ncbi:right-handed parallel beta-helix repeat-containing protein [Treponema primitia]|uniref:right-handed parallel beta-helix repeat-containing protein n=1 Tax=Treponema primitia TaxID=88058 RepID=UPI00397EEDC8
MNKVYHVAKTGSDHNTGTAESPFLAINKAAGLAAAGDTVIVHGGVYREWVRPKNTGISNTRRVVFKAAPGEKVVIKGSEAVTGWEKVQGAVWKKTLDNGFFGSYNPFAANIIGEWVVHGHEKHLGDVYLNGMSFYEVVKYEDLAAPALRTEILDDWTKKMTPIINPEQTQYVWYAEVNESTTTIFANFQSHDPNKELVEINVRRSCFYPEITGIDYVTVSGFELAQAATPWAPPTADQPGLIGPNWAKGWIIENNSIHDAKCSAISIGKEITTGHNQYTRRGDKAGYNYQLEAVFSALAKGWSKEHIGSHIIRNNTIYDCGQNAIVGHLGCVFSEIYDNHIYNISTKREYYGHEIAGIKLHAAIDVQIRHNRIHNCSLGTWLDWQNQGARVSRNIYYNNNRDLFVEVSHGPFLADNNIFASKDFITNAAQGSAFINNLICGDMQYYDVLDRATPYHLPHSTLVKGYTVVLSGDDRWYNNIFVGAAGADRTGTAQYDGQTASIEEYLKRIKDRGVGDFEAFLEEGKQYVYINDNAYLGAAKAYNREENPVVDPGFDPKVSIIEEGAQVLLSIELPVSIDKINGKIIDTGILGRVRIADANFENPDGSELVVDTDLLDEVRRNGTIIGPIAALKNGANRIRVW